MSTSATPSPVPPPITATPKTPATPFAKQAATFSLFAPLVSIFIGIFGQPQVRGNRAGMMILGLVSVLLIVGGLVLGIAALVSARRHGVQGVRGRAITGTCICGLLTIVMLLSIPGLMLAVKRAKERQRQQMQQTP